GRRCRRNALDHAAAGGFRAGSRTSQRCGSPARLRRRVTPVRPRRSALFGAVVALATLVLAACSTSGRELRDTTMTPLPGAGASPSTTGASSVSLIEALGGFALTSPEFVA